MTPLQIAKIALDLKELLSKSDAAGIKAAGEEYRKQLALTEEVKKEREEAIVVLDGAKIAKEKHGKFLIEVKQAQDKLASDTAEFNKLRSEIEALHKKAISDQAIADTKTKEVDKIKADVSTLQAQTIAAKKSYDDKLSELSIREAKIAAREQTLRNAIAGE